MIQSLIKALPVLLLLLVSTSKAQELSLYTGLYNINTRTQDYIGDDGITKNQRTDVTFNMGSFLDFKPFTLYSEFVIDYNNARDESNYLVPFTQLHTYKSPAFTTINTRLGIGKRLKATKQIQLRFISYLGYAYIGKRKNKRIIHNYPDSGQTLTVINKENPEEQQIEVGLKCQVEYQCLKKLYFGVGLDFNLQLLYQNGNVVSETHSYGEFQNLIQSDETVVKYDKTSLNSRYFDVSMYMSYRIWKK